MKKQAWMGDVAWSDIGGIKAAVVSIGPDLAQEMLLKNNHNRKPKSRLIESMVRDMDKDEWSLTGQPIIFAPDGTLLDGQHRLIACLESGATFRSMVVIGVKTDDQQDIDTGIARAAGDALTIMGIENANQVAATANFVWKYQRRAMMQPGVAPTRKELFEMLDAMPGIAEASARVGKPKWSPLSRSQLAFIEFMAGVYGDADVAADFRHKVITGEMLTESSPVRILREQANGVVWKALNPPRRIARGILAYNAFATERPMKILRWDDNTPFPRFIGDDKD